MQLVFRSHRQQIAQVAGIVNDVGNMVILMNEFADITEEQSEVSGSGGFGELDPTGDPGGPGMWNDGMGGEYNPTPQTTDKQIMGREFEPGEVEYLDQDNRQGDGEVVKFDTKIKFENEKVEDQDFKIDYDKNQREIDIIFRFPSISFTLPGNDVPWETLNEDNPITDDHGNREYYYFRVPITKSSSDKTWGYTYFKIWKQDLKDGSQLIIQHSKISQTLSRLNLISIN